MKSLRIHITGQVQGLGFRPHVYRLATGMQLRGTVANTAAGVVIVVQGPRAREFAAVLRREPPPLARVASFTVTRTLASRCPDFRIVKSRASGACQVDVLPDIATCPDCRRELLDPTDRRYRYPFINCTRCGPRYTIIKSLPYDRPKTTMARFRMCRDCSREYADPGDRRFHAQPDACPVCGPRLSLLDNHGRPLPSRNPIAVAARAIVAGKVVAIRSLGGFQLACDASSVTAVRRLRRRKSRPTKPLALMVADLAGARRLARVGASAAALLTSPAAPIVLVPKSRTPKTAVADDVAPDNRRLGVMLAYTPLHLTLFDELARLSGRPAVLVMTSANRRDDPLLAEEDELVSGLSGVFDLVLTHNRPIANRADDSVVLDDRPAVFVRRARGYAPQPIRLEPTFHVKHPTLALGGELRNSFCLAASERAYLSPHLGNLASPAAEDFMRATLSRYLRWTGIRPARIACDLHPDYLSTRFAEQLAREWGVPLFRVQHHYAHAVSVLAEAGGRAATTLALCFDGTGYGTDGAVWGSEFLVVRPDLSWRRVGHLGYLRLAEPGAEIADPARVARAYLEQAGGRAAGQARTGTPTSSLGRLFDAVAAIAGVRRHVSFEGEAAIALETVVDRRVRDGYRFGFGAGSDGELVLDPRPVLSAAAADARAGVPAGTVAARFHNGFARAAIRSARLIAVREDAGQVVLSGGSFQNDILRRRITRGLVLAGLAVRANRIVPLSDGGLSLGQAVATGHVRVGR